MTKHVHLTVRLGVLVLVSNTGLAQGTFQNLDFEHPILPLTPDQINRVPTSDALPGWAAYIGGIQIDRVVYNGISLGAAMISFHGPESSMVPVIQGQYRVYLQPGWGPDFTHVAIAQTGTIPTTALSLRFYMAYAGPEVLFKGQQLSTTLLGAGPNGSELFGVDISAFAGQTGELRFEGSGVLDNIQFSPNAVPEPSVVALLGLAAMGFAWRRACHRC
jgi:hypothetical protein